VHIDIVPSELKNQDGCTGAFMSILLSIYYKYETEDIYLTSQYSSATDHVAKISYKIFAPNALRTLLDCAGKEKGYKDKRIYKISPTRDEVSSNNRSN